MIQFNAGDELFGDRRLRERRYKGLLHWFVRNCGDSTRHRIGGPQDRAELRNAHRFWSSQRRISRASGEFGESFRNA